MEELLVYLTIRYHGKYNKIKHAIAKKEKYSCSMINEAIASLNCHYITILSADYPEELKQLKDPPYVLFYYGDFSLLLNKTISIIGMRNPSSYGKKATTKFAYELSKLGYTIVSGMAYGIDTIAHTSCLETGKTIAILGCGIDYCYPRENVRLYTFLKKEHLVISEYPNRTPPKPYYFPFRNRIVAALSLGVVVIEAKEKSGTMITVGHALDLGKPIFCIPCGIDGNHGCLKLIRDGAILVRNVVDIVDELE